MPYLEHFGLKQFPFGLTPDTDMFYPHQQQQELLEAVLYAIKRGDGFIKITGEVGTGKTLLCRLLLEDLHEQQIPSAFITTPTDQPAAILANVLREFGLPTDVPDPISALQHHLATELGEKKHSAVLVIDEAQALGATGLETVRLLSNLETTQRKLLQIVLFAQPELDWLLQRHDLRQVAQRITFSFYTSAMQNNAAEDYITHRLSMAQNSGTNAGRRLHAGNIFSRAALTRLAKASQGIPRILNVLADKALMAAFATGSRRVGIEHIRIALNDNSLQMSTLRRQKNFWSYLWPLVAITVPPLLIVAALAMLSPEHLQQLRNLWL